MSATDFMEDTRTRGDDLPPVPGSRDDELVSRLRSGNEAAFEAVVESWSGPMLRLARSFVSTESSAEEVVQDTWLAVLRGLDRFEGRSSLRTWVFQILCNRGKSRGLSESRTIPWSALSQGHPRGGEGEMANDELADELLGAGTAPWQRSDSASDASSLARDIREVLSAALAQLPPRQREVLSLRDVEGWPARDVCQQLGMTSGNQRVLLHRARTQIRLFLADYDRQD